jgi:serine protease Do
MGCATQYGGDCIGSDGKTGRSHDPSAVGYVSPLTCQGNADGSSQFPAAGVDRPPSKGRLRAYSLQGCIIRPDATSRASRYGRDYVSRGWIGVQVQPITKEIADSLGMTEPQGALVSGIQANSPAAQAGLKVGDVLTALNGSKINNSRDLARQVATFAPKTGVKIDYLRDGKTQNAQLTIGQLQDSAAREPAHATPGEGKSQTTNLGISVAPASRVMGIGEEGLAVLRVDPAGKGAEAGLTAGDVILQAGGKEISNPDDLRRAFDEAVAQKKQHALLLVRRNDQQMFVSLPLGPS